MIKKVRGTDFEHTREKLVWHATNGLGRIVCAGFQAFENLLLILEKLCRSLQQVRIPLEVVDSSLDDSAVSSTIVSSVQQRLVVATVAPVIADVPSLAVFFLNSFRCGLLQGHQELAEQLSVLWFRSHDRRTVGRTCHSECHAQPLHPEHLCRNRMYIL